MRCCNMTFRKAIGLSIAMHIALFGSAFAFAHYGGSLFPHELRVLTVSLINMGAGERAIRRTAPAPPKTEVLMEPPGVQDALLQQIIPASADEPGETIVEDGQDASQSDVDGALATAKSGFGYSPEEWSLPQSALEKAKIYPRFARERGIEGTVLVRFKIQPSGGIEQVDIVKSSGTKILDEASVRTIYRAAPVPYVEGWVEVPMVYQLRGAEER